MYNYDKNDYENICINKEFAGGCCTISGKCRNDTSPVPEENTCVYYKKILYLLLHARNLLAILVVVIFTDTALTQPSKFHSTASAISITNNKDAY